MTVHRNRFRVNKTNRCTKLQFYWYYDCTCFGQPFCLSSGALSHTSAVVHFMQLWWPFATRSRTYQSWCTDKNSWWWAESLPETCTFVIPMKLELGASVGFLHKESVTLHGHTVLKFIVRMFRQCMSVQTRAVCVCRATCSVCLYRHVHTRHTAAAARSRCTSK